MHSKNKKATIQTTMLSVTVVADPNIKKKLQGKKCGPLVKSYSIATTFGVSSLVLHKEAPGIRHRAFKIFTYYRKSRSVIWCLQPCAGKRGRGNMIRVLGVCSLVFSKEAV